MKNCILVLMIIPVLFFSSCEEWLNIQQEGEITSEQLYRSGNGYRTALNGLYKSMGKATLYGRELSFGMVDCISQQYDYSNPMTYTSETYKKASEFAYKDNSMSGLLDEIWLVGFNVIANANDLLQNIEDASPDLFQYGEMERDLIMGEAYACRALMHFDLLRLYAPAPLNDDQGTYVPYVDVYPSIHATSEKVMPFLDKVIADLLKARDLVAVFDTTKSGVKASADGTMRLNVSFNINGFPYEDFFAGRGYRLSYYSITALLARVYQYAGKDKEAFDCASRVLDFGKNSGSLFYKDNFSGVTVTEGSDINAFDRKTDYKVKSNLIFAVYNEKGYTENGIKTFFKLTERDESGTPTVSDYFVVKQTELFKNRGVEEWNADIRAKCMLFVVLDQFPISGKWFVNTSSPENSQHLRIYPVIRATEMSYIKAEYYARQSRFDEAYKILNDIRSARGMEATPLAERNSWSEFESDLIGDARREWISEGQLFYLYKRLDAALNISGEMRKLTRAEASLPLPSDQK